MLCIALASYSRACASVTGGINRIWIWDPADWTFTYTTTYTALARMTGATFVGGAIMAAVSFENKTAQYTSKRTSTGPCRYKYEHKIVADLPQLNSTANIWLKSLDDAGCCCGLGVIFEMNDGTIFVMGEKYIATVALTPKFEITHGDTEQDSGKLFDEFNGTRLAISGEYFRPLRTFSGNVSVIVGFETA